MRVSLKGSRKQTQMVDKMGNGISPSTKSCQKMLISVRSVGQFLPFFGVFQPTFGVWMARFGSWQGGTSSGGGVEAHSSDSN